MTASIAHLSETAEANQNIMLYWDEGDPFPKDIVEICEIWRKFFPAWNVMLFGKESACRFLRGNFGIDVVRLFLICAVPAKRADFSTFESN